MPDPKDAATTDTATGEARVKRGADALAMWINLQWRIGWAEGAARVVLNAADPPVAATPTASGNCDTDPGCGSHCVCVTPASATPTATTEGATMTRSEQTFIVGHTGPVPAGYYAADISSNTESNGIYGPAGYSRTTLIQVLVCQACGSLVGNVIAHSALCEYGKEPVAEDSNA